MTGRRRTGGGATWQDTSRWRYRPVDQDGDESNLRYADTLADIRTDFEDSEDWAAVRIERQVHAGYWSPYGTLRWGETGPRLERAT